MEGESSREAAIDALTKRISDLADLLEQSIKQNSTPLRQTVTYRTEGMGTFGIICTAIAFCCMLSIAGVAWMVSIELNKQTAELHDLRAWRDVHNNDISQLKSKVSDLSVKR